MSTPVSQKSMSLVVERPWLVLGGSSLSFQLALMDLETSCLTLLGPPFSAQYSAMLGWNFEIKRLICQSVGVTITYLLWMVEMTSGCNFKAN